MAHESDTLTRRTIGPALASAVVGVAIGVAAVVGVAAISSQDSLPESHATDSDSALLGGAEYGTRQ